MATIQRIRWASIVRQALLAGIAGGIVIDLYLWLTTIVPAHGSLVVMWQWIASTALGKAAFTSPNYAVAGVLLHFCASVGWAGGYAYLAATQRFINERWFISGAVYGVVVYGFMQLLLVGVNAFAMPASPAAFANALAAHMIFGLVVAFTIARLDA